MFRFDGVPVPFHNNQRVFRIRSISKVKLVNCIWLNTKGSKMFTGTRIDEPPAPILANYTGAVVIIEVFVLS